MNDHMIDDPMLEPFERFQLKKYGNILVLGTGQKISYDEWKQRNIEEEEEKVTRHFEKQLDDHWNY
jgi:hypothetical protein